MDFFFRHKILALDQLAILQSETKKEKNKLRKSWSFRPFLKIETHKKNTRICVSTLT